MKLFAVVPKKRKTMFNDADNDDLLKMMLKWINDFARNGGTSKYEQRMMSM